MAMSPSSCVRMRMAFSTGSTKIFPSPIFPVWAARWMASVAAFTACVGQDDFDLHLRQEINGVLAAPIDFGVALLPAKTLDLGDGHALQAEFVQGVLDVVQFERFDDGFNFLHDIEGLIVVGAFAVLAQVQSRILLLRRDAQAGQRADHLEDEEGCRRRPGPR